MIELFASVLNAIAMAGANEASAVFSYQPINIIGESKYELCTYYKQQVKPF